MFKQLLLPLAGVAAFIVFVGLLSQGKINLGGGQKSETLKVGSKEINIQIADNDEERAKGLSGITSLGENEGMIFIFNTKDITPSFWMKGMKISLDIIWIDDGKIVKIDKNVPFSDQEKLYTPTPGQPIDYVLEVNAGFSDKNNIKIGDTARLADGQAEGNSIKN